MIYSIHHYTYAIYALLWFIVVRQSLIYPCTPRWLNWHWANNAIVLVSVMPPWRIWVNQWLGKELCYNQNKTERRKFCRLFYLGPKFRPENWVFVKQVEKSRFWQTLLVTVSVEAPEDSCQASPVHSTFYLRIHFNLYVYIDLVSDTSRFSVGTLSRWKAPLWGNFYHLVDNSLNSIKIQSFIVILCNAKHAL